MLSYNARRLLEKEIKKLQENRAAIFTDKIRSSQTYTKLCCTNQNLTQSERHLKNLVQNFSDKIFDALTSRYEHSMPSCEDRLKELNNLLEEIKNQTQSMIWI